MKNMLTIVCLSLLSISFTVNTLDDISAALKAGNATQLSKYFDDNVQVTLDYRSASYSRSQASLILKDFFNVNKVSNYQLRNNLMNNNIEYRAGTLYTSNGSFSVSLYMRQKGSVRVIQELIIER